MTAGSSSRRCQSYGAWSGSHPTCTSESFQRLSHAIIIRALPVYYPTLLINGARDLYILEFGMYVVRLAL